MIQKPNIDKLEEWLSEALGASCRILAYSSVGGGSINSSFRLETTSGQYFLKVNSAVRYPNMFEVEAKGLTLLSENSAFKIPKPVLIDEFAGRQFLLMDWIEEGKRGVDFATVFGTQLAKLHQCTWHSFGLDHSNYIGSLPQSNMVHDTWVEFLWLERLLPQISKASRSQLLSKPMKMGFDRLESQLDSLFPKEPPSLVHGDLWSGNYTVSELGIPCLFDPAVYFGHREMDLAMMKLFGGFDQQVFDAYNVAFPLHAGWEDRIPICQLYPLMVHANLFGGDYCNSVIKILNAL